MTIEAQLADGRILEFPDGTNPSVIQATVKRMLAPAPAKEAGFSLKDIGAAFGQGVAGSAQAITNVAGAGNAASQYLGDVSESLGKQYTPERQAEMQRQQQRMKKAEESGSILEEIKAAAQNIYEAPLQSAAQGLGSFVPYIPAIFAGPAAAALGLSSRAVVAANVVAKAYAPVVGTAQGAGSVKGAIYDAVYKAEKESGLSESEARQKATAAQDYTGKNLDQIALGAGLGYIASKGGVEKFLTKEGREKAADKLIPRVTKAVTEESITEGAQGGQERLASNIALQRTGRDVPTFQGVAGQAAQEGIIGGLTSGAVSIPQSGKATKPVEDLTKRASTTAGQEALDIVNAPLPPSPSPPPPKARAKDVKPVINPPVGESVPVVDGRGVTPAPEGTIPSETVGVGSTLRTPVPDTAGEGQQSAAIKEFKEKSDALLAEMKRITDANALLILEPGSPDFDAVFKEKMKLHDAHKAASDQLDALEITPSTATTETKVKETPTESQLPTELVIPKESKQDKTLAGQPTYTEGAVSEVPVSALKLSEDVPQFKSDANQSGVVQSSKLEGKFDRRLASPVQVWERNDGSLEVISGRHRLDLAQRSGEKTIPAQIYKESEGFDADKARMLDIELNVKDGRGKVKDYVSFFKEFGLPKDQARAEGLLNTAIGRQAYEIADAGSPSLIAAHFNKEISDDAATAIAINAPKDDALQNLGMAQVKDGKSINHAVNFMRSAMAAGFKGQEGNGDLFGFDDSFAKEAEAVTQEATKQQREARQQLSAIKGAAKSPEKAKLGGVDVKNIEQTKAKIAELEKTVNDLENFHTNPELYKKLRQDAGLEEGLSAPEELKPATEEKKTPPKLDESKVTPKKGRHPQMQAAAKLLQEGKMTREEFEKYSDYYKPIEQIESEKLLPPTSDEKMLETVDSGKRDKVNVPIEDGTIVGLRMDLPARERGGAVVSIHEGRPGLKTLGKLLSFKNVAHLVGGKDGRVTFEPRSQEKGLGVAIGENKAPQQTVEGKWKNVTAEAAYAKVKELMGNPAWSQIGFDPSRHGYFYDRKTREPVKSASEVYQVGQFLLAKDVEFAPKSEFLYSLRGKSEGQIATFEQSLRTLLNKFGLKDVGLKLSEGMRDEGSYATKLIQIAADSANPIRALRHEAIHALRELGFFTDAQWSSLSKMAKDKWVDQYLKQRNVDGKPLKSGEESRYDAYMREYKGDMEKITEEAVADAFADFDATKPPAGMVQTILQKLRNLFQSIKSALTKMESAEQIFSKVEKGALKPEGKLKNADIRKNLRSQAGPDKASTDEGQAALDITTGLGRVSEQPDANYMEKVREAWDNATDNPKATAAEAKSSAVKFIDLIQTKAFSSDAAINNSIRRQVNEFVKDNEQAIGTMLKISQSQVVHADALANLFLTSGNLKYNKELYKYEAVEDKANIVELAKQLGEIKDKYGLTQAQTELIGHTAFEAKRLKSLVEFNNQVDQEVAAMRAEADTLSMQGKEVAANALKEKATRRSKETKFIHMTAAEIAAGNKLFKVIPELNGVVDTWNQMRDNAANLLVDSGLWSKSEAEFLLSNADYVPFFREEQLEKGKGPKEYIRGLMVQAQEKKLKGSNKPVNDIFDNMNRWTQYSVNRAVRNRSALSLIDTAAEFGQAKKIASKADGDNAVRVWRNGKEEFYDMADPMFVEAFTGLESITIPAWKWASTVANILRQSVVLNPLFTVAQIPQDSFAAMFTSGLKAPYALQIPARAVKEFAKTLVHRSATNNELKKYGVVGVRDFTSQMARLDAQVYAGMKAPAGLLGKLKNSLEHIAMAGDNAVRQATYEAAMAQGLSKAEALEKSFEIWNIRRKGTSQSLALASQVIPFFGAYLAAQNVAIKTISGVGTSPTERKAALGALIGTTASVMTLSLLYAMMNGDDEDYLKKPAAIRDRMLMVPGTNGFGIPLRSDLFSIPKIITEHMYLMITDKGYEDGRKFRDSMANALSNSFLSPTVVPQAIKPGLEVMVNYDFFQGRPLIGEYQKRLEKERQFNESTSELAKILGKTGLVSPISVDHLIRGMFGSAGGLTIYMTNPLLHSDPNVEKPTMSVKDMLATIPGASSFISKEKESGLKGDFYVLRDEVTRVTNTLSDLKQRSPEKIVEYISDPDVMAKLAISKGVQGIDKDLGELRKAMTQISNLPTSVMDSDEKQKQIQQLREAETTMLKAINVKKLREMAKL